MERKTYRKGTKVDLVGDYGSALGAIEDLMFALCDYEDEAERREKGCEQCRSCTSCTYCMPGACESRWTVIDEDEREQILQAAIDYYGIDRQVDQAIEEMAELTKALLKMRRPNHGNLRNVLEEIVDVQIMLDQLRIIYGWLPLVETAKLARLQRRVNDAQKS